MSLIILRRFSWTSLSILSKISERDTRGRSFWWFIIFQMAHWFSGMFLQVWSARTTWNFTHDPLLRLRKFAEAASLRSLTQNFTSVLCSNFLPMAKSQTKPYTWLQKSKSHNLWSKHKCRLIQCLMKVIDSPHCACNRELLSVGALQN